ncbi:MAG: hypothetical protein IPM86_08430 [Saprospiraceae bacterium]|nr:hypothetical protein [Saprospiraceae bacterium]
MYKNTDYNEYSYDLFILIFMVVFSQPDGLGLGEVGELEAQMFSFAQMPNRITNVQFSTSAPILPNPCSSDTSGEQKK